MRAVALLVLFCCVAQAQTVLHFQLSEQPGPHAVGLKIVEQYDYTRPSHQPTDVHGKPYTGGRARPIQTLVWYPAQPTKTATMTVADYTKLLASETDFVNPHMSADWQSWTQGLASNLKDNLLAVLNAVPVAGRFPVIIYAPASFSWENADLCEYLAGHGYIVIAGPALDATVDVAGANIQARDIAFLLAYAQMLPNADASEIAVAGWSFGGLSALFAAARDPRIDALVELDGSMRYYPGIIKQAGDVHPDQMTIPLIFFAQGEFTLEDQARYLTDPAQSTGPSALNAWTHGDLTMVHDLALMHTELSSMFQRNEDVWKNVADQQKADYGREYGTPGYAWICRYTLNFLSAYLKHDSGAEAFLKRTPAQNGVPQHLLATTFRPAQVIPIVPAK